MSNEVLDHGLRGAQRITAADSPVSGNWHRVKALNGTVTFDAGCAVKKGEAPADGDELVQGDELTLPFSTIAIKSGGGILFAYNSND